jgi:hypothetical protein
MSTALPPLVDTVATRLTLHRLAENVLAAEQVAANGEFRLDAQADGFATRWFAGPDHVRRRIRVAGAELIRESGPGTVRESITGDFDPVAASVLYAWWDLGTRVLTSFAQEYGSKSSDVVLYPEHFDVGSSLDLGEHRKINLGFSPGDDFCPAPYVYAGPWEQRSGEFWNAPFGAYRRYDDFESVPADEGTRAFLVAAIAELTSAVNP